jgi:hypothetical protein
MTVGGYPSRRLNRSSFLSMMCCYEYNAHSSRKVSASGGRLRGEIVFEGAIRPFTRSYFFGLTQKVTKKVKASSSPFLLEQEFFSFAALRPVRRSPYLSLRRSFRSFRPGSPHPAALQDPPDLSGRRVGDTCGREFALCDSSSEKSLCAGGADFTAWKEIIKHRHTTRLLICIGLRLRHKTYFRTRQGHLW